MNADVAAETGAEMVADGGVWVVPEQVFDFWVKDSGAENDDAGIDASGEVDTSKMDVGIEVEGFGDVDDGLVVQVETVDTSREVVVDLAWLEV